MEPGPVTSSWAVEEWSGTPGDFHALDLPFTRALWWCRPVEGTLVLGSGQPDTDVDASVARARRIEVVRRRTGGGAVWVDPVDTTWFDVVIPRADELWTDDVSASMTWLGDVIAAAIVRLDPHGPAPETFAGPFEPGPWGRTICFAGSAPGEVFVAGRKVAGLSQRRGREGARFQCIVHRRWRPEVWADCLADAEARRAARELPVAELDVDPSRLVGAVVEELNRKWGISGDESG